MDTYEELKAAYKKRAAEILVLRQDVEAAIDKLEAENTKIQKQFINNPAMPLEESRKLDARLTEVSDELRYYWKRRDALKQRPPVTKDEVIDFMGKVREGRRQVTDEAALRIYELLQPIVEVAEKYTTEINKWYTLDYCYGRTLGSAHGFATYLSVDPVLPPILAALNTLLLDSYNRYDKLRGNERHAKGYNGDALHAERQDFLTTTQELGAAVLPDYRVTT